MTCMCKYNAAVNHYRKSFFLKILQASSHTFLGGSIEAPSVGAEGGGVWGGVYPTGEGSGEGPCPRKFWDFFT